MPKRKVKKPRIPTPSPKVKAPDIIKIMVQNGKIVLEHSDTSSAAKHKVRKNEFVGWVCDWEFVIVFSNGRTPCKNRAISWGDPGNPVVRKMDNDKDDYEYAVVVFVGAKPLTLDPQIIIT